jgi:hypothetical protein
MLTCSGISHSLIAEMKKGKSSDGSFFTSSHRTPMLSIKNEQKLIKNAHLLLDDKLEKQKCSSTAISVQHTSDSLMGEEKKPSEYLRNTRNMLSEKKNNIISSTCIIPPSANANMA